MLFAWLMKNNVLLSLFFFYFFKCKFSNMTNHLLQRLVCLNSVTASDVDFRTIILRFYTIYLLFFSSFVRSFSFVLLWQQLHIVLYFKMYFHIVFFTIMTKVIIVFNFIGRISKLIFIFFLCEKERK